MRLLLRWALNATIGILIRKEKFGHRHIQRGENAM